MALYKRDFFQPTSTVVPPSPDVEAWRMQVVENQAPTVTGGEWRESICLNIDGAEGVPLNDVRGEKYAVYWPILRPGEIHPTAELVAAPCPPFCKDQGGGALFMALAELEDLKAQVKTMQEEMAQMKAQMNL